MEPYPAQNPLNPDYRPDEPRRSLARLPLAIGAGLVAALIGGGLWAALVAATGIKLGYAAIGVGFLVGLAIRGFAHGHDPAYGYVGAILALLGCVVGDVLSDSVYLAKAMHEPALNVITHLTPKLAAELLKTGFQPMDALFYAIAAFAGYRNSFSKGA